jgi:hypothetical protein
MSNTVFSNILRFFGLVIVQVFILKIIVIGGSNFNYVSLIIYPLFLMLLPIRTPHSVMVLLGFVIGILIDAFYDTYGVHASASVFIGFIRPYVLNILEPKGGYLQNSSPTKRRLGPSWFFIYSSVILFAHLFFYFSVEAFTFYYIKEIIIKTVSSFLFSIIIIMLYQYIFDPLE